MQEAHPEGISRALAGVATASNAGRPPTELHFDDWRLRMNSGELYRGGVRIAMQEKPLKILEELVACPGEVVSRQHLIATLWPDRIVEFDTALNTAVKKLRAVLEDDPERPRYIETVPRKGYRFIASVMTPVVAPEPAGDLLLTRRRATVSRSKAVALALLAGVVALATVSGASLQRLVSTSARTVDAAQPAPPSTDPVALDRYLRAKELIAEIVPNEPELSRGAELPPRGQALALLDEALRADPLFAHAHVLRARVHLDFFVANLDISEERLAAARSDLERARQLSQDPSLGRDVRGLYAAFVDVDVDRALAELGYAHENDPVMLLNQARVLTSSGRFGESDDLLRHLLLSAPSDPLMLRMRVSNFLSQNRPEELFRLVRWLSEVGGAENDMRAWTYLFTGVASPRPTDDLVRLVGAAEHDSASERLFATTTDLMFLRHEQRYHEVQRVLDASDAATLRFGSFIGASPGLGQRPVAEPRGWNALLLGDPAAAAVEGRKLLVFVDTQRYERSNRWVASMLRATGLVFMGDRAGAVRAVEESLREAPLLRQVAAHRAYLAATVLAWAGEQDQAVALLEMLTAEAPGIGPVRVVREPLLTLPLQGNARFERLAVTLEQEMENNRALERSLPQRSR